MKIMRSKKPILLVEDDNVDAMIVQRAMDEIKVANRLERASDGEAGLEFLRTQRGPLPCLVLLDLNMPRMNGFEFLKIVKEENAWKTIPVIVLTTSQEQRDVMESYQLGVAGYMQKPVDYRQFVEVMRTITLYWTLSELPE
jgi:CheY-like chemotaxis protein